LDNRYQVAELGQHEDVLEAIRRLENRLSEQNGKAIALVAYSAEQPEDEQ
jgi:hypothetical protein